MVITYIRSKPIIQFLSDENCSLKEINPKNSIMGEYCENFSNLEEFYAFPPFHHLEKKVGQAEDRTRNPALVQALLKYNQGLGASEKTLENIRHLDNEQTLVVITGQQPGLFTGPLYTIYKAITAIKMAKMLEERYDRPIVPIFWIATEDHDFAEVDHCKLIDRQNNLVSIKLSYDSKYHNRAVGTLPIDDPSLLETLKASLPETDFTPGVLKLLSSTREASRNLGEWFAGIMTCLFKNYGLVLTDPNLPAVRSLGAPLMEKAIEDPLAPTQLVNEAGEKLQQAGYKQQIIRPPENCAFFIFENGYRSRVTFDGSKFRTDSSEYSANDLKNLLKSHPERFSTGVIIRPVMSEYLFKSVISVGGPGEIGYFAQLKDVYTHFDVPMPVLVPRLSLTVIETRIQRILANFELQYRDLRREAGGLISEVVRGQTEFLGEDYWQNIIKNTLHPICIFRDEAEKKDKSFLQPVDNTLNKMSWLLGQLQDKVIQTAKKSEEKITRQIVSAKTNLYPANDFQERQLNIFYFLNKYGPHYINQLIQDIPIQSDRHHILKIMRN